MMNNSIISNVSTALKESADSDGIIALLFRLKVGGWVEAEKKQPNEFVEEHNLVIVDTDE